MASRLRTLPVLVLATLLWAGDASAQTSGDTGLFSVTPARQVVNGRPPRALDPFLVSNTTKVPLDVRVIPGVLDQRLSGEIFFDEDAKSLRDARRILEPDVGEFRLEAGERRTVRVTWRLRPLGEPVLNMGVIFQSTAATESTTVQTVQRLLTLDFLQLPGDYSSTGRFTSLRAEQGEGRTLDLIPRIENTGEIVQSPQRGRILVRDAAGEAVFRAPFVSDIILPGHERDFPVLMKKVLPKGDYRLSASATFGESGRIVIRSNFTLVGPNQLPTPRVRLEDFGGRGEIGGDSEATGIVHSIGTATAESNVKVQLYRLLATGQRPEKPIEEQKLTFSDLEPGAREDLRIVYPGLPAGDYRLIATYRDTPETLARVEADFSPVAPKEPSSLLGPILGGVGVVVAGALFFLLWRRRRKKDDEEEEDALPAVAVAAAPAAPVPAGLVDVNTATVEELQRLPGVGPKAAARIVEHREEYGRFESLEDLGRVEGFGGKRLEALAGRVSF